VHERERRALKLAIMQAYAKFTIADHGKSVWPYVPAFELVKSQLPVKIERLQDVRSGDRKFQESS